ncbi:MAG: hypothetical protein LC799_09450 [Actinobacteria bacterium]|nr:hypothetical protein [Actinomycetota bacterium]
MVTRRRQGCPDDVEYGEGRVARETVVEPRTDGGVLRVVTAVGGHDHGDVEQDHASAPDIEVATLVECFMQCPVRVEVDSGARAGTASEHWDRRLVRAAGHEVALPLSHRGGSVRHLTSSSASYVGQAVRVIGQLSQAIGPA